MRRHGRALPALRGAAFVLLAASACYTTLDPTLLGSPGSSEGSGGVGGLAPCSFENSGATQYIVCSSPLSYPAAAADCAARGADLAAIQSEAESAVVAAFSFSVVDTNVWLGGTRNDDQVWSWPDGSVFWRGDRNGSVEAGAYARWQPGEPNNSSTVTSDPERCLAMTAAESDWNDRSCSLLAPYVCERTP